MTFGSRLIPYAGGASHAGGSSRGSWSGSWRGPWLVALGALALVLGGCEDKHIGRPCNTNVTDAGTTGMGNSVAIVSEPNLACPERICLQAAPLGGFVDVGTAAQEAESPMCTATCSTDDDCSDNDPATPCKHGFVCAVPTTSGPFCCQKLCVCHDFVIVPQGGLKTPNACLAPSAGGPNPKVCDNVQGS
ncbi:MAG TPA: hypothetical protein VN853_01760 [Polyangia bacterium]|nr:hypothetical protein [Polyangia bacterium]